MGPINITGIVYSVYVFFSGVLLPLWIWYLFVFNMAMFVFYCTMEGYGYFTAVHKNRRHRMLKSIFVGITTPAYWAIQWLADIRAIKQEYIGSKVFWEKTFHPGAHMKGR